ncbi:MAG: hypothetical protein KF795_09250 [Labilithrix sp.]|nr:hypothetical protein [Labilithrix sp.]
MRTRSFLALLLLGCGAASGEPIPSPDPAAGSTGSDTSDTRPAPGDSAEPDAPAGPDAPVTSPDGGAAPPPTLRENRDRLIDTLATRRGTTRCPLWTELTDTQRGVFLTISDLLGKRSFVTNDPPGGKARAGADLAMALDHVTMVYDIRDSFGKNGGAGNRIWLQVDATLIAALRDFDGALPEWSKSKDFAGPHAPFDASSETNTGQPTGQAHFWSADAKSKPLGRPGVEDVDDPRAVEIDIDYNLIHDSNPEGTYFPNGKGRAYYTKVWTPKGVGGSPELDYVPTGCAN